ncbi:MAG: PaaI family thioesterase [Thermoanaerobaculia bacterium]
MKPQVPPPTYEFLNAETIEESPGRVRCRFRPTEAMTNPWGAVQGGILAAFFDDTMGPAVFSIAEGRGFTTVSLNVSYLRASRPGEPVVCEAEVVKHGRTQAYVEASLTREADGALLARASAVQLFLEPAKKG